MNNYSFKNKTFSAKETKELAKKFAENILNIKKTEKAFVVALKGDLGGGKTTFIQGLAKGLGIKEKVNSPTFNILKIYKLKNKNYKFFYHFDCYRIEKKKEMSALGFEGIISDPQNIVAIEWAEKIKTLLPKNIQWIKFNFIDENTRKINF
jgi:tRNA threonylcarbamoyladenosine biosynthesis protein TsaE